MTTVRVLRTAKVTLSKSFFLDEVAAEATGSVVVSISRLDGTLVQSGNATPAGTVYSYTFGGSDTLDLLTVTWSATVGGDAMVLDQDVLEITGGFFFGLSEGRAVDRVLLDTTKYPTADLIDRRMQVEAECERITGQSWVPRFCRETLSGDSTGRLRTSHTKVRAVRAVTVNGVAYASPTVTGLGFSDTGMIYLGSGTFAPTQLYGSKNVTIEYEHGHDRPDTEIVRAAKLRFKSLMLEGKSALPDRAERVITVDQAGGSVFYGQPDVDKTGIPAVDAVYRRYPSPRPGFG